MKKNKLLRVVSASMFIAISFALYLIEIPLVVVPSFSYLKIDLSDIPALLGGIVFGPFFAFTVEFVKNLLELIVRGFGSQMGFGNIMNLLVGCAYVVPFSLIVRKYASGHKKAAVTAAAAAVSAVIMIIAGLGGNYVIAPLFFKYFLNVEISGKALWSAVVAATVLNAVKALILTVSAFPLVAFANVRLKKALGREIESHL